MAEVEVKGFDDFSEFNMRKPATEIHLEAPVKELSHEQLQEQNLAQAKQKEEQMIDSIIQQRDSFEDDTVTTKEVLDRQYVKSIESIKLQQDEAKKHPGKKFTLTVRSTVEKPVEKENLYESSVAAEAMEEKAQTLAPKDSYQLNDDAEAEVKTVSVTRYDQQPSISAVVPAPTPAPTTKLAQDPYKTVLVDHPTTFMET